MGKCCSAFGHRIVINDIDDRLDELIQRAIDFGCDTFYLAENGDFDKCFSSAVRRAKKYHNIKAVLVKCRLTNQMNANKEYYYQIYDDVIIPIELSNVYYKQIITKRNHWMVDHSDIVLGYTYKDYGGAYDTLKYAHTNNKKIWMV